ncbi:MAG: DUF5106 domain-containing protein [Alistipes sp.]|nr:DUF5106 domain-containing protein [Alistipes sp.]
MKNWIQIFIFVVLSISLFSCNNARQKRLAAEPSKSEYTIPKPPPALQGEAARKYMLDNMWKEFDFADTLQLSSQNDNVIAQAFVMYVGLLPQDGAAQYMSQLMQRCAVSKQMLGYFLTLAERVLHDPNSPMRDDEKYIPVLEVALASGWLDEYERLPYEDDLRIAMQNRVGRRANDFSYTLASGKSGRLYDIKSEYTIIFISNPDCPMCRGVREQILQSEILSDMVESGRLKILVLYPDEDLALWREHLGDYPKAWINAYDKGGVITRQRLYDLKAIPALYLLDSEKRVLVKDSTDVPYIENVIAYNGNV